MTTAEIINPTPTPFVKKSTTYFRWYAWGGIRREDEPTWLPTCWGGDTVDAAKKILDTEGAQEIKEMNPILITETAIFEQGPSSPSCVQVPEGSEL